MAQWRCYKTKWKRVILKGKENSVSTFLWSSVRLLHFQDQTHFGTKRIVPLLWCWCLEEIWRLGKCWSGEPSMIRQQGLLGHGGKRLIGTSRGSSEALSCQLIGSEGPAVDIAGRDQSRRGKKCVMPWQDMCLRPGGQLRETPRKNYGDKVEFTLKRYYHSW